MELRDHSWHLRRAQRLLRDRRVLDRQRRDPVVPPAPPSPEQQARMREEGRAARADGEGAHRARVAVQTARLRSPRWAERAGAASYLGRFAVVEARPEIERLLDDPYPEVAEAAADAHGRCRPRRRASIVSARRRSFRTSGRTTLRWTHRTRCRTSTTDSRRSRSTS